MTTLYPIGYGTELVPLAELRRRHALKAHPEFSRRLFAWLESMGGLVGIGGGWRSTQPDKPGFAVDGKSFHQSQTFASGIVGYCAVDLVARNPGNVHRSTTWAESATAPAYGLHTFIKQPPEPWHMQCLEMRGWQAWVNAGRPDPARFNLPTPTPPPVGGQFMHATIRKGDVNADVYGLQVVLRAPGSPHGDKALTVDGVFGEQTDTTVRKVQAVSGLVPDGIVGPKTWAVIDGLANS